MPLLFPLYLGVPFSWFVSLHLLFFFSCAQNLTGEFMWKIYATSGNLVTDSWSWLRFVSSYYVLTVFLHWICTMKYICYQESFAIHGCVVFAFFFVFFLCSSHFFFCFLITFEKYSVLVSDAGSRINYQSVQSWGWLTVYNLRFSPQRPLVQLWCTIVLFASWKILLPVRFIPAPIPPVPAMLPCVYNTSLTSRRLGFLRY